MSNRRRPNRTIPLNGTPPPTSHLPFPLDAIEWSDQPPAMYEHSTLTWIASKAREIGKLNAWRCEECGFPFIAFDRHPGTTPMMVSHQAFEPDTDCKGLCASVFYARAGVERAAIDLGQGGQQIQPSHEWYRPSADELRKKPGHVKDHVYRGGLLVREATA